MANSSSHVTLGFPHAALTPLADMTFQSLSLLQRELNANSSSVHSNRGDGLSGHLVLTCRPAEFATLISPAIFDPPTNPGTPPTTTSTNRASVLADYNFNLAEFNLYALVDNVLRQQLINAVPNHYISTLLHPLHGFSRVTTLSMLTHLWTNYVTITPAELQANAIALHSPSWIPTDPIESLFIKIQTMADFAEAGGAPINDLLMAQAAYSNVEATGLYGPYCDIWRAKPTNQRTFLAFKSYFTTAYKDLHRATTSSAGYHSANVAASKPDEIAQLRREIMEIIKAELVAFKLDMEDKHHKQPLKKYYCHTHGSSHNPNHTSQTCKNRSAIHQENATYFNKMVGSTMK